jgi:flagellar capping protein FliD
MMTLALAIVIPLSMLIYSNSRITEAKETLRAEIGVLRSDLLKEMVQLESRLESRFNSMESRFNSMESRFSSIDRKLDEILRIVGDHETRITRLEQRPN